MTDEAPSPRVAAVARLRRAASQREMRGGEAGQEAGQEKPRLQRTASERARDMAMAKLMGSGPAENAAGPNTPTFRTAGPPPTLEELQKRHVESRPATPATPASPNPTTSPSNERQEARTNLIRKLSRGREGGGLRGAASRQKPDGEEVKPPPIPLQPFEIPFDTFNRSDSSTSNSSRIASTSTAATSRTSRESEPDQHIRAPPPSHLPLASTHPLLPSSHASSEPTTASFTSDPDSSPTDTMHSRTSHAPSVFRAYRHTMERDRDSAIALMRGEDLFEFDSSGQETDSPRFPVTPNPAQSPAMPSPNLAAPLLAPHTPERAPQHRQPRIEADSPKSNGLPMLLGPHAQAAARAGRGEDDGVGLGLSGRGEQREDSDDEDQTMTVPLDISPQKPFPAPEPGYRFPGPAPSHSLEHAALRAQPSTTRTATPHSSVHSDHMRNVPLSESLRRPRKSSLSASQHSNAERPQLVGDCPPRASSRATSHTQHSRNESHATSYKSAASSRRTYDDALSINDSIDSINESSESEWEERAQRRVEARQATSEHTKHRILSKLGSILSSGDTQPRTLDDPPRHLLLHAPVLQVVNANTVKDRYLFLFSDVLLIAKPLVEEDPQTGDVVPPTLETRFLVKSVVEVSQLKLTAGRDEDEGGDVDPVAKRKHPQLLAFVDRFGNDPRKAVGNLVAKGGIANDAGTIANLLFRTPELNRAQLGVYLSARESRHVLKAYVERFRLHGIRIEDALRAFLASIRLPAGAATAEHLLNIFANGWLALNPHMSQDATFARKLVIAMLELNDFVNSIGEDAGEGALRNIFAFANPAVSVDDFIAAFRVKDPTYQCSDETLTRIYLSIKKERLQQAADNSIASVAPEIAVTHNPPRMPSRLTYRMPTQEFTITLPRPDPKFSLKLVGHDLRVEPSLLSFARSRSQSFRVTGLDLGHKTLLFLRLGPHAMHYTGIPINRSFSVERAFMKHTFQLAFVNHLNVKRKYMFSLQDGGVRSSWVSTLHEEVEVAAARHGSSGIDRATLASQAVALQVMRDALIAPDEVAAPIANGATTRPGTGRTGTAASRPGSAGTNSGRVGHVRSNSVSRTYAAGMGKDEVDISTPTSNGDVPALPSKSTRARMMTPAGSHTSPLLNAPPTANGQRQGSRDEGGSEVAAKFAKTGHELVMLARQNSLLPSVLGLMNTLADPSPFKSLAA